MWGGRGGVLCTTISISSIGSTVQQYEEMLVEGLAELLTDIDSSLLRRSNLLVRGPVNAHVTAIGDYKI